MQPAAVPACTAAAASLTGSRFPCDPYPASASLQTVSVASRVRYQCSGGVRCQQKARSESASGLGPRQSRHLSEGHCKSPREGHEDYFPFSASLHSLFPRVSRPRVTEPPLRASRAGRLRIAGMERAAQVMPLAHSRHSAVMPICAVKARARLYRQALFNSAGCKLRELEAVRREPGTFRGA